MHKDPRFFTFHSHSPRVPTTAYVAEGARLIGEVVLAPHTSIWFNAVLRADGAPIKIGEGSNVQDCAVIHVDDWDEVAPGSEPRPTIIGQYVSVAHGAVLHSCTIEDDCLIGMNATVLGGAHIGRGSIIAAGAVVAEGMEVPPFSLVAGVPGKVRKTYQEDAIITKIRRNAELYIRHSAAYLRHFDGPGH